MVKEEEWMRRGSEIILPNRVWGDWYPSKANNPYITCLAGVVMASVFANVCEPGEDTKPSPPVSEFTAG